MIVVVPYATLYRRTVDDICEAIEPWHDVRFVQLVGGKAYWTLFRDLWEGQEGFLNIEQDMGITKSMANTLVNDTHPCCACKYQGDGGEGNLIFSLGVIRFSDACLRRNPEVIEKSYFRSDGDYNDGSPDGDWHQLDNRIYHQLRKAKVAIREKGKTEHYHAYRLGLEELERDHLVKPGWQDQVRATIPTAKFETVEAW